MGDFEPPLLQVPRYPRTTEIVDWKPYTPTWPSSFFALPVGARFYATDLAGLSQDPFAVGIGVTRTSSGPWTFDLDAYRVDSDAPPEKHVKVDRWPLVCNGSDFLRAARRSFPPGPSGHYPGALPLELERLLVTDPSSARP